MYQLTNVLSYQLTNIPIDQCTIPLSYQKAFNTLPTDINFSELYYQNIIITNPNIHQPYSKLHIQRYTCTCTCIPVIRSCTYKNRYCA